ncbi:MAG: P-II family nitrogen regulator [Thermoanaerobaculia bacterium]|nr:MAG: P-II family nitrogen regulator [Thermoanaerobaculia bacterium]
MASSENPEAAAPAPDTDLWMVVAIIQPFRLDAVTLALEAIGGFGGMTVSDCRGFGRGKVAARLAGGPRDGDRREGTDVVDFKTKTRIDIAVAGRDQADLVVETVARAAHTGRLGDGKIFLFPLARAVRVRTSEEDERAL